MKKEVVPRFVSACTVLRSHAYLPLLFGAMVPQVVHCALPLIYSTTRALEIDLPFSVSRCLAETNGDSLEMENESISQEKPEISSPTDTTKVLSPTWTEAALKYFRASHPPTACRHSCAGTRIAGRSLRSL